MKIEEAKEYIPVKVYDLIRTSISEFTPPQEKAVRAGLFREKNMLVSAPTASGKTLIAEMAILNSFFNGKKSIYIAPMRALISEKFEDFKSSYPGIKPILSIGDYDEKDMSLGKYDVIFASTEKFDSLIRKPEKIIGDVGCIVYDEIHLLSDLDRGATLEFLITFNRHIFPKAQIICLSATVGNGEEIADWLEADLVESNFRPVKLSNKIYLYGELLNGKTEKLGVMEDPVMDVALHLVKSKKQALVFAQTRRSSISIAKLLSKITEKTLNDEEKASLMNVSKKILSVLEVPTSQCEELSEFIKSGVAFHNAGLLSEQRKLVEEAFKAGLLKFIVSTPTLALGVNLPANTVLISSIYRYSGFGMVPLTTMEIRQMMGRAGRPKYDKEGTAVLIARNEREESYIRDRYIDGDPEPIASRFNNEIAVRKYVLALICTGFYPKKGDISRFFSTLFASYSGLDFSILIDESIEFLLDNLFIESSKGVLSATLIGRLINSLYLDPLTGAIFLKFSKEAATKESVPEISVLHAVSCSQEFKFIHISQAEFTKYEEESYDLNLMVDQNLVDYEKFISAIKLSRIFEDWISEKSERYLEEEYGVTPGEFYSMMENFIWLINAMARISAYSGHKSTYISKLGLRLRYGVKEELLPLVAVPGIGRVRGRRLFNSGIKSLNGLRSVSLQRLSALLGEKTGEKVFKYLHVTKNDKATLV
ncbi:DEAD/DEAH box helicase [Candidatus Parvarchaeota archaeon]|nr:DEAD/DEAH box helicase [Candidatus Parvarchaeota archaeon]